MKLLRETIRRLLKENAEDQELVDKIIDMYHNGDEKDFEQALSFVDAMPDLPEDPELPMWGACYWYRPEEQTARVIQEHLPLEWAKDFSESPHGYIERDMDYPEPVTLKGKRCKFIVYYTTGRTR